jgi:uncharacterized membrane protein
MTRREIVESIFTILAIIALWPVLLNWEHPLYQVFLGVILVILCVLVIGKFRRIRKEFDKTKIETKRRRKD